MTNNPTIDGVSREFAERTFAVLTRLSAHITVSGNDLKEGRAAAEELRALLDAPAVERQEPVARCRQSPVRKYLSVELLRTHMKDGDLLYSAPPEVAALQSTIARLEARIAELESEEPEWSAMQQRLGDENAQLRSRVDELESGRGEPVAWSFREYVWATGLGAHVWREKLEREAPDLEETDFRDLEPLFTAPPAPVAVVPDGWKLVPVEPTEYMMKVARGLTLQQEQTPSAEYRAMVKCAPACLDATAALNGPAK